MMLPARLLSDAGQVCFNMHISTAFAMSLWNRRLCTHCLPFHLQHMDDGAKVRRAVALSVQRCAEPPSVRAVCNSLEAGLMAGLAGDGEQRAVPKVADETAHELRSPTSQAVQPSYGSPDTQRKVDHLLTVLRAEQCNESPPAAPAQLVAWEGHSCIISSSGSRPCAGRAGGAVKMQRLRQQLSLVEQEKAMLEKLRAVNAAMGRSRANVTADGSNGSSKEHGSRPPPTVPRLPLSSLEQGGARTAAPHLQPASGRENMGQQPFWPSRDRRSSLNAASVSAQSAAKASACRETHVSISALLSAQVLSPASVTKPEFEVAQMQSDLPAEDPGGAVTVAEKLQKQQREADEQLTPPHFPTREASGRLSAGRSKVAASLGQLSPFRRLQSPPITPAPGVDSSLATSPGMRLWDTTALDVSTQRQVR